MDACEARSSTAATKNSPLQQTCDSRRLVMRYDPVFFCFFFFRSCRSINLLVPICMLIQTATSSCFGAMIPAKHLTVGSFSARTKWNNGINYVHARQGSWMLTIRLHHDQIAFFQNFHLFKSLFLICSICFYVCRLLSCTYLVLEFCYELLAISWSDCFLAWVQMRIVCSFTVLALDLYAAWAPWGISGCLDLTLTLSMSCWRRANRGGASLGFRRGTQSQALMT